MAQLRILAGLLFAALLVACGTRADAPMIEAAREAALSAGGGGVGNPDAPGTPVNPTTGAPGPGAGSENPTTGLPGPANPAAPTDGATGGPGGGGGGGGGGNVDTRSAPPGGNGGATDVGVTETEILLGNVADITGAVAGLFADVQKAAQAYQLYFASTEGTIYGRQVKVKLYDTQLTRNGNFNAYTDMCNNVFMGAVSMSAFDEGVEEPVRGCGIPDLRAAAVNPAIIPLPSIFSSDSMSPTGEIPLTEWEYWKQQYPDAIAHSAYIFVDNNTTRAQTDLVRQATQEIGYSWPVYAPVDLAAISYKTQIRDMKNEGVRLVTFQGAYQQAAKLAREMVEESMSPDVYALQMNVYDPRLIQEGGQHLETINTNVQLLSQMVEEVDGSPELQTYREWLKYIDPQAEPTGLGEYAWSGMRLIYETLKEMGPEVTREKMIEALSNVEGWEGNGIVPPQDIGDKIPSPCTTILQIQGGQFVRLHPRQANTFDCTGQTVSGQ